MIILFYACKKDENSPDQIIKFSDEYILQHKGKYLIEIPEVYELSHIVMAITYQNSSSDYFIQKNTSYYRDVIDYFNQYNTSGIFSSFNYSETDFNNNYSFRTNSYCYMFENDNIISKEIYPVMWQPDIFKTYKDEIQDFSLESKFRQFYADHLSFYNSQIALYDSLIQIKQVWSWLEGQFSSQYDCYKIMISPLTAGSHNTKEFETDNYKETLMFVSGFNREIDSFDTTNVLLKTRLFFTEIDHNYVNPVSDIYIDELNSSMSNLTIWKDPQQINELYDNAYSVFNEYMTWAVYDLYVLEKYPKYIYEEIRETTIYRMETGRGFIKFQEFEDYLISLYQNITDNEKIEDLYPKILKWVKDNN